MRKGFTLIELMIVVSIIAVIAAIAIPNLWGSKIASNEMNAVALLTKYVTEQSTFIREDRYAKGTGAKYYANASATSGVGNGYPDLYQVGYKGAKTANEELLLIDATFANAHSDLGATTKPRNGYQFDDIEKDSAGTEYDYTVAAGLCAAPFSYNRGGRQVFVVQTGDKLIYSRLARDITSTLKNGDKVTVITQYPAAADLGSKWLLATE